MGIKNPSSVSTTILFKKYKQLLIWEFDILYKITMFFYIYKTIICFESICATG